MGKKGNSLCDAIKANFSYKDTGELKPRYRQRYDVAALAPSRRLEGPLDKEELRAGKRGALWYGKGFCL